MCCVSRTRRATSRALLPPAHTKDLQRARFQGRCEHALVLRCCSLPEEEDPPQPLLSSESVEWDAIANLDDFFRRIYK